MTLSATFVAEFSSRLQGLTEPEIVLFTRFTRMFVDQYAFAYQMCGDIDLVLDNSVIQRFKHRDAERANALRALAFVAFCRFVTGWSDRPTSLAISPFAIYEHHGRKPAGNSHEAGAILHELSEMLAETGLSAAGIGFADTSELFHQLGDVQHDEGYLTNYLRAIDAASWEIKLSRPIGTLIPFTLAWEAIPSDLPLRYFSTRYVRYVFASRIERLIIAHSQRDPAAATLATDPVSRALAKLNRFKRGNLQGLGDIDILQICDLARQFQIRTGRVLLGQTLDRTLWAALKHMCIFSYRAHLHDPTEKEPDVTVYVDPQTGVRRVLAEEGRGTSTVDKPGIFGHRDWEYLVIPKGTKIPNELIITKDHYMARQGCWHYSISPNEAMDVSEFLKALDLLAENAGMSLRVQRRA